MKKAHIFIVFYHNFRPLREDGIH